MELSVFFKSVIDQDDQAIVICNLDHEIVYMNSASVVQYAKRGGSLLLGRNLLLCHGEESVRRIQRIVSWFAESQDHNRVFISHKEKKNLDIYMVALRDENKQLIGYYEKQESRLIETASCTDFPF
jgi:DUF438 domain-containing protein